MGRPDGTRVLNAEPMYYLIPHFLTERHDSMNMITEDIPVEPLRLYMNEKRKEGVRISHLALIVCAYMKAVARYPDLNRFIVNRKIYDRNEFCVSMVVLRPGNNGGDTMSKIYLDPQHDTIFDVQKKIDDYVEANRVVEADNGLDNIMAKISKRNWLIRIIGNLMRWADRHNLLPKAVIDVSPFHASLLISNLASIRTNHIYHHIYDFGTTSVGITMGNMRDIPKKSKGEIVLERCIPLGVVMDERIASGHYFAQAFAVIHELLADPAKMEQPEC